LPRSDANESWFPEPVESGSVKSGARFPAAAGPRDEPPDALQAVSTASVAASAVLFTFVPYPYDGYDTASVSACICSSSASIE